MTCPVVTSVSHATRLLGSCVRIASRIASEIWSATLSGWPMVTDSLVNRWVLRRNSGDTRSSNGVDGAGATTETRAATPGFKVKADDPCRRYRESRGSENVHPRGDSCKLPGK